MSDLMASLWTPEVQSAVTACIVLFIILYVLSIIWVVRDSYLRGAPWVLWGIVSLIPVIGVIAYCLLRPPLFRIDRDEQELEIALKQRQLQHYGECGNCGYPVEADYVVCPQCHTRLKNLCPTCHHALEPQWSVCPYCATQVGNGRRRPQQRAPRQTAPHGAQQPQRRPQRRVEDRAAQ